MNYPKKFKKFMIMTTLMQLIVIFKRDNKKVCYIILLSDTPFSFIYTTGCSDFIDIQKKTMDRLCQKSTESALYNLKGVFENVMETRNSQLLYSWV